MAERTAVREAHGVTIYLMPDGAQFVAEPVVNGRTKVVKRSSMGAMLRALDDLFPPDVVKAFLMAPSWQPFSYQVVTVIKRDRKGGIVYLDEQGERHHAGKYDASNLFQYDDETLTALEALTVRLKAFREDVRKLDLRPVEFPS